MIKSDCLCQKNSQFLEKIVYKNETVFKDFDGIIIGKCLNCGLLKTVFCPKSEFNSQETHVDFYEKNRSLFLPLFENIVKRIKKFKDKGKILDVGCSSGLLLKLLKKERFSIFGIEPNKTAFQIAQKKFKEKVYFGTLQQYLQNGYNDSDHQIRKFDVVIYNHVVEHIADVEKEIKLIKQILKSKGLLILGAPNTSNIIFYLRKKYWESLMPLEHIWHFSKNYLINYLKKQRFKILDISFSDDKRQDYPFVKKVYFSILSLINQIIGTGESMLIIAQLK